MAGKEDIASKILKTQDPKEQHQLGKTIKPDKQIWNDTKALEVMEQGVRAKFVQNDF